MRLGPLVSSIASMRGGNSAPVIPPSTYSWAADISVDTWKAIPNTSIKTWALAGGITPTTGYNGTNPLGVIDGGYNDPAVDLIGEIEYAYGGGHGDGSCNAVVRTDLKTMQMTLQAPPTHPALYPPSYANGGSLQPGPLVYPSTLDGLGFFLSLNELSDPADTPYATPLARAITHIYGCAIYGNGKIHYLYRTYAEFDTVSNTWSGRDYVGLGQQMKVFNANLASPNYLDVEAGGLFDPVTGLIFATVNPGDIAGGWHSHILVFDGTTRNVKSIHGSSSGTYGLITKGTTLVIVGRKLFCFPHIVISGTTMKAHEGFWLDLDAMAVMSGEVAINSSYASKFVIDPAVVADSTWSSSNQAQLPAAYDGVAIRRWNYGDTTQRGQIMSLNPTPVSGSGSIADPYVLTQTSRNMGGDVPPFPGYINNRLYYLANANTFVIRIGGTSGMYAFKLA